jgi:signal transduction histidine kinase
LIAPPADTRRKWRPNLSLVVFLVLVSVLLLPLFSLYFLKLYQNQLIQQTESELIAQSAALSAVFKREVETSIPPGVALGARVPAAAPNPSDEPYQPIYPKLELATESVLPPRPAAHAPSAPADPAFVALGARMTPDLLATQYATLAGFRLLDPNGTVIAGRDEVGMSLSHLEEVAEALQGRFSGTLRVRISKHEQPSLYSMSRGTGMRVFTAMPVIVRDQVAGVVYASRTPSNVFRYLYDQRAKVALAVLFMIVPTLLIGFLFHRTITEPMRELIERTSLIGKGDRDALRPLRRHGTSEFARLSQSFLDMARRLNTRSSFISTFATHVSHELKSPLTSIQGAAELLREDVDSPDMDDEDRRKFLDNIIADAGRLAAIAGRLRDFARAENPVAVGATRLGDTIAGLRPAFASLDIGARGELDTPMRISEENAAIVFSNLADNAARHGSSTLDLVAARQGHSLLIKVSDNGEGVSPNNRAQIFDSFFTTRRDSGGTGMGLAIVRAMLDAHGGAIRLIDSEVGTAFELTIPVADAALSG